ncbi:MAG: mechanosensitive ion channel [Sulfuricella sp.]|nr:mechanosensitive ion channel [Sulfuricella sp.]
MDKPALIHNLLLNLTDDLGHPALLWQFAVLVLSVGIGWVLSRAIRRRLPEAEGVVKLGLGSISRVVFPLAALLMVLIGKAVLRHWFGGHVNLLNIAVPLLGALALIRLAVYLLRHAFAPSGWLHTFERFITWTIWLGLTLHLTGFLPEILDVLDDLAFHLGKQRISVLMILAGGLSVLVTLLIALWLGRALEARLMRAETLDMNLRVVLTKVSRAVLILLAVLIALPAVGIDLTVLSVFGGALGVGLGFGLQKIASNYVSGFIILLDHSIHPGDILTVENRQGAVSRLTGRYMVLKSQDGTEAIIPNDTLITSTVINHSYSDRKMRIGLSVQVAYGTDVERVMGLMVEAARQHPRVLADPAPKAYLKDFADNGIDLELGMWINDPEEGQLNLKSDLNLAIWRIFRREGIEIPYPQREVRILNDAPPAS